MSLKLQPDPTFKAKAVIPLPGGKSEGIEFIYKYRDVDELSALLAEWSPKNSADAAFIMEIASGWDLIDPFDAEHVALLVKNYHAAARVISSTYVQELLGDKPA